MRREDEIREKSREIRDGKRYDFHRWMDAFIIPSRHKNWSYIVLCGGDKTRELNVSFLAARNKRVYVEDIDGTPHTVVKVRNGLVESLARASNLRSFFRCLTNMVAEADIRRFHYDLWLAAHNLEAKVERLKEIQTRSTHRPTETEREVFSNNTIRAAARHYGQL